jgi:LAO/AO transport system kinase
MLLCEAAGYDIIIVETVGVGQSETLVSTMVDVFILLILPGSGDDIQGIKRGIMELADIIMINKADGDRLTIANQARKQFRNAISLIQPKLEGWTTAVEKCSGMSGDGLDKLWKLVMDFVLLAEESGYLTELRENQNWKWFNDKYRYLVLEEYLQTTPLHQLMKQLRNRMEGGQLDPIGAVMELKKSIVELTGKKQ